MVEKISVNPVEVRCLGDIVDAKATDDFDKYLSKITTGSDTVLDNSMNVYTCQYLQGTILSLTVNRVISTSSSSFSVTAVLKNMSDTGLSSTTVYLDVNGTVTSAATNGSGSVTFTVNTDGSSVYYLKVYYPGSGTYSGCFALSSVFVADVTGFEYNERLMVEKDNTGYFLARVTGTDLNGEPIGVPNKNITVSMTGFSASALTDKNGRVAIPYLGTGAGKKTYTINDGSNHTGTLFDCLSYDSGLIGMNSKNWIWNSTTTNILPDTEGTLVVNDDTESARIYWANKPGTDTDTLEWSPTVITEFDILEVTGNVRFQFYKSGTTGDYVTASLNGLLSSQSLTSGHFKVYISNGYFKVDLNNTNVVNESFSFISSGDMAVRFNMDPGASFKYKDFMLY